MNTGKKNPVKTESKGINLDLIFNIGAAIVVIFSAYIAYRAFISGKGILSVSFMALYAGLIFETSRISQDWRSVSGIFIICYFASLMYFLPRKGEEIYHFENHIRIWPYFLCAIFTIAIGTFYRDKVIAKLHETITLMLSLSLVYWIIVHGVEKVNGYSILIVPIVLLFSLFSVINAVTHIKLTRTVRLVLSVWSTIILLAFAVDNFISVYRKQEISPATWWDGVEIALQYFFLGISAVYVMQNYRMLVAFLPSKKTDYRKKLKENKEEHINRYSSEQAKIGHLVVCMLFAGSVYWVNYRYELLPVHTAVWFVLFIVPVILRAFVFLNRRENP